MSHKAYDMKSAGLDALEKELGLLEDETTLSHDNAPPTSPASVQSAKASERRIGGGCVQSVWLLGVFGGCVPAACACWLHDWAILNGDRYAGKRVVYPSHWDKRRTHPVATYPRELLSRDITRCVYIRCWSSPPSALLSY